MADASKQWPVAPFKIIGHILPGMTMGSQGYEKDHRSSWYIASTSMFMPGREIHTGKLKGLSEEEVVQRRRQVGKNLLPAEPSRSIVNIIWEIVREPMFLLLAIACALYFILGESSEGFMMVAAILIVTGISLYQDMRSTKALEALKVLAGQQVAVIRDGIEITLPPEELVPDDIIYLEEGNRVPADARVIESNDLSLNESILTGESLPVEKDESAENNTIYQGTTVNAGSCYAIVTATGFNTSLGKLGKSIHVYVAPKTQLQKQVNRFVKLLAIFGFSGFVIIWLINYLANGNLVESMLFGLTIAMAAIPEEIPVAFTSFMALGAYQMSRLGIISRQPQTIESLGSVTVICLDKTGTITENKMKVISVYDFRNDQLGGVGDEGVRREILGYAMLASETRPFDVMEAAILEAYNNASATLNWQNQNKIFEYPLGGRPPMMTHVYKGPGHSIVAAKGALERIIRVCALPAPAAEKIFSMAKAEASKGYRLLGVASAVHREGEFPESQDAFEWKFEGFISLYDPPKQNAKQVFGQFNKAQIDIRLLTGDYAETAINIAGQVGMHGNLDYITGEQVMTMTEEQLKNTARSIPIFARMFPEAKLRVVKALQANGHIVAMTGDGVNDSLALQAADVGIAMGKGGTEMARQTADLVLTDDNLEKIVGAIGQGRKIFANLKKAVRYIISIHIPIILTAVLPLLLGWKYPNLFTPIHVIFLELIMGPTCSLFFEREPLETNAMSEAPRGRRTLLFERGELLISIVQGLIIAGCVLAVYYYFSLYGGSLGETRAMVFTTLVFSNLFLTFTNRSFTESFARTIRYKNTLAPWIWLISFLLILIVNLVPPVRDSFGFSPISFMNMLICAGVGLVSVSWFELYKALLPRNRRE